MTGPAHAAGYGGVLLRVGCYRWVDAGNMATHREAQRERMTSLQF